MGDSKNTDRSAYLINTGYTANMIFMTNNFDYFYESQLINHKLKGLETYSQCKNAVTICLKERRKGHHIA